MITMHFAIVRSEFKHALRYGLFFLLLLFLTAGFQHESMADTLGERYPGLTNGLLKSAVLEAMDADTLLISGDIRIKQSQLMATTQQQEPKLRLQLEKNLIFVLEQEATQQILLREAQRAGISNDQGNDSQAIQRLFEQMMQSLSVSENEMRTFYSANKEMMGGAPFEQVADNIRGYLLQDKKQQMVENYIQGLGNKSKIRLNEQWTAEHGRLAKTTPWTGPGGRANRQWWNSVPRGVSPVT